MAGGARSDRLGGQAMSGRSSPIRVLHIIQNLNYGGMERLVGDIVRGIDPQEFESHILPLQYVGRFGTGLSDAATIHTPPRIARWSMLWPSDLAAVITRISPDVVHSHSGVWYKASLAARMARVSRIVHTEHGRQLPDPRVARTLDHLAARRTSTAVAVSSSVAQILEQHVVRGRCPIEVVLNGVDVNRFNPHSDTGKLRRELQLAPSTPIIGSIGRLEPIKGYDVMIAAFAQLVKHTDLGVDPVLVIAGDGSERTNLEARIQAHGLGSHVHLLGWRDDVQDLLSAFTCFTMSSRSEGTSVSLLEAMSCGLCPVVTDVGGNRAVLGDRLDHLLVPSGSPDALAAVWANVLTHDEERTTDGSAARQRVIDQYSGDAMLQSYARVYHTARTIPPFGRRATFEHTPVVDRSVAVRDV